MGDNFTRLQSRRTALKLLGLGGLSAMSFTALPSLVGCKKLFPKSPFSKVGADDFLRDAGPIDRSAHSVNDRSFSGDQPERPHSILWDKSGYFARKKFVPSVQAETGQAPLVVIGGGVSGLLTAYLLADYKPIVLEQAQRFGGNSKGETFNGLDYSIGAAYFTVPDADSPDARLLAELGVDKFWKEKNEDDPVSVRGKIFEKFWQGDSDTRHRAQFQKLGKYFRDLCESKNGQVFPDIPITNAQLRPMIEKLDEQSFIDHLRAVAAESPKLKMARGLAGSDLHPHIETAIEQYCWSSFGASSSEISAAMGLNFYAGEFGPIAVPPGGNSSVAERVLQRLTEKIPYHNLRTGCLVFDVREENAGGNGVLVSFENPSGGIECLRAQAVVMACPKFVVKHLLDGIEPERMSAISKLRYNSYLVGNVLLKKKVQRRFYDLYMLGDGHTDMRDVKKACSARKVTDVVLADYAKADSPTSVLSLYRAFPYAGSRGELYAPDSYARYRAEFETQISKEILPLLGLSDADIADLRVTRWGHPLPVAAKGLIRDGTIAAIRKPWRGKVFFVEQDNWMLPAFETALGEALAWAPEVRKVLGKA